MLKTYVSIIEMLCDIKDIFTADKYTSTASSIRHLFEMSEYKRMKLLDLTQNTLLPSTHKSFSVTQDGLFKWLFLDFNL